MFEMSSVLNTLNLTKPVKKFSGMAFIRLLLIFNYVIFFKYGILSGKIEIFELGHKSQLVLFSALMGNPTFEQL